MNPVIAAPPAPSAAKPLLSPTLLWTLVATIAASVVLLMQSPATAVVEVVEGVASSPREALPPSRSNPGSRAHEEGAPLPAQLPTVVYAAPQRDIFSVEPAVPLPAVPTPLPATAADTAPPAEPEPAGPPPVPYRLLARMAAPDGTVLNYLAANDDVPVKAVVGEALQDGYRVDAVDADRIVLKHQPTGFKAAIALHGDAVAAPLASPGAMPAP